MKFLIKICACFVLFAANAQDDIVNIYCKDFTLNDSIFDKGDDYRKVFESLLQSLDSPPLLIERDKIDEVIEVMQEEKNLRLDFNQKDATLLKVMEVDYLLFGNFNISSLTGIVEFQSECIKISGENSFLNIVFPTIRFTENEFISSKIFELRVKSMLNEFAFTNKLGVVPADALNELEVSIAEKDKKIKELEIRTTALIEYSDMSKLNIYGSTFYIPGKKGSTIIQDGPIISQMSKVFRYEGGNQELNLTEDALNSAFKVIDIEPRFPFSYYAIAQILRGRGDKKWISYAYKAKEIFGYTTMIKGCSDHHIQCLSIVNKQLEEIEYYAPNNAHRQ